MIHVLMAVKNGEKYLKQQIDSILRQRGVDLKLFVRDNNSSDRTREIVGSYGEAISLICGNEKGLDAKGNFSKLMESCSGRYTMLADCDDLWLPDKVAKTAHVMQTLEECYGADCPLLVHTDLSVVDRELHRIAASFWRYAHLNPIRGVGCLNRQLMQNTITGSTVMVNRPLLNLALPIPEEALMHDWWLGLVAAAFGAIDSINEPLVLYRQHGENDTGAKKYTLFRREPAEKKRLVNQQLLDQTGAFARRFGGSLSERDLKTLLGFEEYLRSPPLLRVAPMVRHRLYKSGWLRTLKSALSPYFPS